MARHGRPGRTLFTVHAAGIVFTAHWTPTKRDMYLFKRFGRKESDGECFLTLQVTPLRRGGGEAGPLAQFHRCNAVTLLAESEDEYRGEEVPSAPPPSFDIGLPVCCSLTGGTPCSDAANRATA